MENTVDNFKDKGNSSFRNGDYENAIKLYLNALESLKSNRGIDKKEEIQSILFSNLAACELKLLNYDSCIAYCTDALNVNPLLTKAFYRRASAYEKLGEYQLAFKDVNSLLHFEPANSDGIALMRRVNSILLKNKSNSSDVKRVLDLLSDDKCDQKLIIQGLKSLVGLCYDDKSHSMEFGRKDGISIIVSLINLELMKLQSQEALLSAIRIISAASNHKSFIESFIDINSDLNSKSLNNEPELLIINGKLSLISFLSLLNYRNLTDNASEIVQTALITIMTVLKALPLESNNKLQSLNDSTVSYILKGFLISLKSENSDIYSTISQSISAFLSKNIDYFEEDKYIDTRLETLEQRKERIYRENLIDKRVKLHTSLCFECGIVLQLINDIDSDHPSIRHHASTCLGKIVNNLSNYPEEKDRLKSFLKPFLEGYDYSEYDDESKDSKVIELSDEPSIQICRKRAALEATLLVSHPELGAWSIRLPGGIKQLFLLVSTGNERCQGIAAEVMCLAATTEAAPLLAHLVSKGILNTLLNSPSHSTRAAAASTLTKLAIKAKALTEDSSEVSQILNTVLSVLKFATGSPLSTNKSDKKSGEGSLVSFSSLDEIGKASHPSDNKKDGLGIFSTSLSNSLAGVDSDSSVIMTSVERSIEVLAAMVGKTHVKEEIVHGSYRSQIFSYLYLSILN